MTNFNPKRLIDDPAVSAHLRADLQVYAGASSGYSAAAGLQRLQQQLLHDPGPIANSASSVGSWGIVGLVSAVGLGVALLGMVPESTPKATSVASLEFSGQMAPQEDARPFQPLAPRMLAQPTPKPADRPAAIPDSASFAATNSGHQTGHRPTRNRAKPVPKALTKAVQPPPTSDDNPYLREVRQLNRARSKLATNPREAYELAQRGRSEFPDGALTQEWEGLAILALAKQGLQSEAQRRGKQFLKSYPHGTFAAKVRAATNL
ncbi:MAG: hypothetical protein ACPG4T_07705 [Nannocystaceae bacterium]